MGEGVQATWLALGIGTTLVVAVQAMAVPLVSALAVPGEITDAALPWVRIASLAVPAILIAAAGNGWGLLGIWAGLSTFMVLRLVFVWARALSGRWLVPGTSQV